jgi:hypothetical protein
MPALNTTAFEERAMINTQITAIASLDNPHRGSGCTSLNVRQPESFRGSDHDRERNFARKALDKAFRDGILSRTERDIARTVLNLWFFHRGPSLTGVIRPGRAYLARKNKCSVRTVASLLKRLRDAGILATIAYAKGGRRATQYRLDVQGLMVWCGVKFPEVAEGALKLLARPLSNLLRAYQNRAMAAHGSNKRFKVSADYRPEVRPPGQNWWEDWAGDAHV